MDIREVYMNNVNTGIAAFGNSYKILYLIANRIKASNYGVRSFFNYNASLLIIYDNEIHLNAGTGLHYSAAIDVAEPALSSRSNHPAIYENEIEIVNGFNGIALNNTVGALVEKNNITMVDATKNVIGIYSFSTKGGSPSDSTSVAEEPLSGQRPTVGDIAGNRGVIELIRPQIVVKSASLHRRVSGDRGILEVEPGANVTE